MHPILFHFGLHEIHAYSVFYPLAAFVGILLTVRRARIEGFDEIRILRMFLVAVVGVLIGSRLLDVIARFPLYREEPSRLFSLHEGVVFYGGYLGAIAGAWLYLRLSRHPFLPILDIASTYLGAGCCYGCPTTMPWGVVFPAGSPAAQDYGRAAVHPTQLYEAALGLIIFFALVAWRRKRVVYGEQFALSLYLYSIGRFIIEFFRGDDADRGFYGPLSTSQWISLALFACAVALTFVVIRRRRLLREHKIGPQGISRPHDFKPLAR
jgi:phosphatidylglycerol:prolipoprotein diacylglycerol transferase